MLLLCHGSTATHYDVPVMLLGFTGITMSNTPVPVRFRRPITMFPEGVVRSSKSPCRVASDRNAAVVSYDALSKGDGFVESPLRLKGL